MKVEDTLLVKELLLCLVFWLTSFIFSGFGPSEVKEKSFCVFFKDSHNTVLKLFIVYELIGIKQMCLKNVAH